MKLEIAKAFGAANENMASHARLTSRVQTPGESVLTYLFDKLDLCARYEGDMTERQKIDQIVHGLLPEYMDSAYEKEIPTVEALTKVLKRKQALMDRKERFASIQSSDVLMHRPPQQTGDQAARLNRRFNGTCHECKKIGHYARDCYRRKARLEREEREGNNLKQAKNDQTGGRRYYVNLFSQSSCQSVSHLFSKFQSFSPTSASPGS